MYGVHNITGKQRRISGIPEKVFGSFSGKCMISDRVVIDALANGSTKEYQRLFDVSVLR